MIEESLGLSSRKESKKKEIFEKPIKKGKFGDEKVQRSKSTLIDSIELPIYRSSTFYQQSK